MLEAVVAEVNRELRGTIPDLDAQRAAVEKELTEVRAAADGLLGQLALMNGSESAHFAREKLDDLGLRRLQLEDAQVALDTRAREVGRGAVSTSEVAEVLGQLDETFEALPPYRKKELVRLVLARVEVSTDGMLLHVHRRPPRAGVCGGLADEGGGDARLPTCTWLARKDAVRTSVRLVPEGRRHLAERVAATLHWED